MYLEGTPPREDPSEFACVRVLKNLFGRGVCEHTKSCCWTPFFLQWLMHMQARTRLEDADQASYVTRVEERDADEELFGIVGSNGWERVSASGLRRGIG